MGEANKVCCCAYSIIIQTKKLSHYVIISVYIEKPQSEMMKPDDKERIIAEEAENAEKVPKIQVYTNKALTTAKKPWFPGCLGVALASFAVLLSLAAFLSFLGYMGMLPQKLVEIGIFDRVNQHETRLNKLEKTNICVLPKDPGNCKGTFPRWYFDTKQHKCLKFVYSGCLGNANNFESENECNENCFSWGDDYLIPPPRIREQNSCNSEPDAGPCRASMPRYYFDKNDKSCKTFLYGGCDGNRNNFQTEKDCYAACGDNPTIVVYDRSDEEDICILSPETGTCRGSFQRWYFDSESGLCEDFEYGGCDANANNFETKEDCENYCQKPRLALSNNQDVCSLPSAMGPCRAAVPKFFFNGDSGKCEMFMYGGCSGNGNNFETLKDCETRCITVVY